MRRKLATACIYSLYTLIIFAREFAVLFYLPKFLHLREFLWCAQYTFQHCLTKSNHDWTLMRSRQYLTTFCDVSFIGNMSLDFIFSRNTRKYINILRLFLIMQIIDNLFSLKYIKFEIEWIKLSYIFLAFV